LETGEAADLKGYTVGVEAFAKPPGYDPKTDSSVRVQAGKLRRSWKSTTAWKALQTL
jgi:hypothetical protein